MTRPYPSADDLTEMQEAAGCACCISGSCDLVLASGVGILVNDYSNENGYTTEGWNFAAAPCSSPNYRKRIRVYPPQPSPVTTYVETDTCEPGPVPSFTTPRDFTDAEWPTTSPGGYEYEVTFFSRTAIYNALNGGTEPLVLDNASGQWPNSAYLRFIVSIGVTVSQIRGIYHYQDQIYCDGVLYVPDEPDEIVYLYSPWEGVGGDPLTERTIDIDINPPDLPEIPTVCGEYEDGWEVVRTLVLDGVQCVGYSYVASEEAVYCYDEFGGPVTCGDPSAVFCYDGSFNSVPCP